MVGFQKYPVVFWSGKIVSEKFSFGDFSEVISYQIKSFHSSMRLMEFTVYTSGISVIFNGKIILKRVKWPSISNSLSDFDY